MKELNVAAICNRWMGLSRVVLQASKKRHMVTAHKSTGGKIETGGSRCGVRPARCIGRRRRPGVASAGTVPAP
jgi:hypothetical protein